MNIGKRLFYFFKGVRVFALVGPSGTGKSYHAKLLSEKLKAPLIIDDGLLIEGDAILAGRSAKREKTYLGAVKCALFNETAHRDEILAALAERRDKRILILGTSEKMANKIAERLNLPAPQEVIKIEDIASPEEIEKARISRTIEGKHVIPVPSMEIKKKYPQIFCDRVKIFFKRKPSLQGGAPDSVVEKSVVRPQFSQSRKSVTISQAELGKMASGLVKDFDKGIAIKKLTVKTDSSGCKIVIVADLPFETQLITRIYQLQEWVIDNIEKKTGILIEDVNIVIDKIIRNKATAAQ